MFNGKSILVTGGTGSFGRECISHLLKTCKPERVIVFSRDELKQSEMQQDHQFDAPCMRYFLGDVRDRERLIRAFRGVSHVIHAAALKQVPAAEYNPHEFIKTNIDGAANIVDAAVNCGVERVVAVSTDKAVNPINLYGATKLCSDKVFIASNSYASRTATRFSVVRYGNVIGSRGSVIPVLLRQRARGKLTVTDPRMTRFLLSIQEGVKFVLDCMDRMAGGEIFVPKIPSCRTADLVEAMSKGCAIETIGRRPGEKMHEVLISEDEAVNAIELADRYIITPSHSYWGSRINKLGGKPCPEGFSYASNTNPDKMTPAQVSKICQDVARTLGIEDF
ncbi:MAG: UDP-N-acetylglucosamine 4,6-dehydratase (inverting) [Opitutaceae bacterium]